MSYAIQKKWNFDPASTRLTRKALGHLDRAKDHLLATGLMDYPGNQIDMTLETRDAWQTLDAASKRVAAADDDAQTIARPAS
jgi:hypothetical protein